MNETDAAARLADMPVRCGIERGVLGRIDADNVARILLPIVRQIANEQAAKALRAAAREQRQEADRVPWDDEGTHADGHRCAAGFLDRRAAVLRGEDAL